MPRPLSARARAQAIDAATDLLAEEGIEGFSVDAVARRSGVAKSTLYRHWASSNELLIDALDCHVEPIPVPDTGSLHDDLLSLYESMRQVATAPAKRQLLLDTLAAAARDPELAKVKAAMMRENTSPIRVVLDRAVERGEIEPIDPDAASALIHGPLMVRVLLNPEPIQPSELAAVAKLVVRGLGG